LDKIFVNQFYRMAPKYQYIVQFVSCNDTLLMLLNRYPMNVINSCEFKLLYL